MHRVRLRNLGTTDKKSSHKIKHRKIPRVHLCIQAANESPQLLALYDGFFLPPPSAFAASSIDLFHFNACLFSSTLSLVAWASFRVSCFFISISDFWQIHRAHCHCSRDPNFLTKNTAAHSAILLCYIIVNICSFYFPCSGFSAHIAVESNPFSLPHRHQLADRFALRRELRLVLGHDIALGHVAVMQISGKFRDTPARLRDRLQRIGK